MGGLFMWIYKYLGVLNKENDFLNIFRNSKVYSVQFLQLNVFQLAYSQNSYDNMMAYCIVQLSYTWKS